MPRFDDYIGPQVLIEKCDVVHDEAAQPAIVANHEQGWRIGFLADDDPGMGRYPGTFVGGQLHRVRRIGECRLRRGSEWP